MKYIYFDASAGLSGNMVLGALIDLGVEFKAFLKKMAGLRLPVDISIEEVKRASLRGLKVNVRCRKQKSPARRFRDIESLIRASSFSRSVQENSLAIFRRLFTAEAKVHGTSFETAHLHEAGADDALVDVVGCCYLAEILDAEAIYSSPLNVGSGWVKTSHGVLPVPPPAVAELLKGIPSYSAWVKEELVTPTGAAIISTLAKKFMSLPELVYEKIGYGAGSRDFPDFPNILRAFCGEAEELQVNKKIYIIETTIDDSSPQVLASFIDHALALGALDVFLAPVVMKKNRLGTKLTVLAGLDKMDSLIEAVFRETSSIGVRYFPVERRILKRAIRKIKLQGEVVGIKTSYFGGKEASIQPEFSDCLRVAQKKGLPVKEVIEMARVAYWKKAK
jgi:uncharacterized protein (TIGR00299 family) protein